MGNSIIAVCVGASSGGSFSLHSVEDLDMDLKAAICNLAISSVCG